MKNRLSLAALNSGQALIIAITMTVMMWMAVSDVQRGTMTLGDLTMINAYLIQIFIPLNALGFIYREIRQSLVNIERMFTLLGQQAQVVDKEDARELPAGPASIRFDNVRFGYQPERRILDGISFEVPAGHKVAVVGRSGAGKSTIGRLLFRFFDVSDGAVLVNGVDIRDLTQSSLRAAIGVVPQDTVLFNDTIWNNIAYGRPDASAEEVRRAAQLAHLDEFIAALPEGYDSKVGERGLKVSGGEKQRIAIARVLLKNPPILLLDEATSSLDSHAEQAIINALNEVAARRTTLVIAHRLSTIRDADEILVLDQGRIVERGHHDLLLAQNGVYASLWRQQQRENSKSPA
jgi:ATP-binding cassette subfamily B protein